MKNIKNKEDSVAASVAVKGLPLRETAGTGVDARKSTLRILLLIMLIL